MDHTQALPVPAPSCPVLNCPWQESEDDKLEGHLYDGHSARVLAATLTTMLASFETQAAIANGLLNELTSNRDQVITELAELIAAKRNSVHAACGRQTADGMDRARTIILNARASRES